MRGVIPVDVLRSRRMHPKSNLEADKLTNDIQYEFDQILNRIYGDNDKLLLFLEKVRSIKDEVAPDVFSHDNVVNKAAEFEKFLGVSKPDKIDVRAVEDISNKGCGTGKRLTSGKERAIKNAQKKRKCKSCGLSNKHDSRNCPSKKGKSE